VPGHLVREGDRWLLRLLGTLSGPRPTSGPGIADVLHGQRGQEPITLLDCSRLNQRMNDRDVLDETWLVRTAIRGAAVGGWDEPAFDSAQAEMDDLDHFMDLRLVRDIDPTEAAARLDLDLTDGAAVEDAVAILRPPRMEVTADRTSYELFSGGRTSPGIRDYRFEYRASLHVITDELVSLTDMHRQHLRPLSHLLSLVTGRNASVRSLRLGRSGSDETYGPTRWEVLDVDHDRPPGRGVTVAPNMLFTCSDWDFSAGFPVWKQVVARYGPTCDLLFARNAPGVQYLSTRFLNAVTAAESFHRRWTSVSGKATADHKARIKGIVQAVPEHERAWLRDQLAYSHEPSLRQRLVELIGYCGAAAEPYVGTSSAWAKKITDARNALVHRPVRRDDPEESDPLGLDALEQSAAAVTTACLLRELGFTEDEARDRMRRGFVWSTAERAVRGRHPELFTAT
jgi:hypothetical protein